MSITPNERPNQTRPETLALLAGAGISLDHTPVVVVGVRGYYPKSFGNPETNDRGVYDDAFFLISPRAFKSFNGSVDPSILKTGIASLLAGIYNAVKWMHRGRYRGYQIVKDRVTRDGLNGVDAGRHGINFHKGRSVNTDSVGCQTVPESQYADFVQSVDRELDFYAQKEFTYLLVDKTK